jgi:hypothetical protein
VPFYSEVLDESLLDALDDALNADTPNKRTAFHKEAREIIQEYTDYVDSDPLLGDIDANGITDVKVRASLRTALANLSEGGEPLAGSKLSLAHTRPLPS